MAKKKKIVVDLDLPKDDPTQRNFLIILFLSIMLGTASGLFWITNSGFLPTANGEPMFTNLACSTMTGDQAFNGPGTPTYAMNESCSILKDNPEVVVWEETEGWENVERAGASFDMPGIDRNFVDGVVITQPVTVTCTLSAPEPTPYTVAIRDKYKMTIEYNQGVAGEPGDDCSLFVEDLEPGERYEFGFWVDEREQVLSNVKFRFEAQYYDGIPDNMNNKSLWLGPTLGDTQLRPMIFLNFFGLTFFLYIFPASYYAERVALKRNEKEDKFPDFLRDLAEYWKGGLSMTVAVQTLATSEYGALNDEVRKMSASCPGASSSVTSSTSSLSASAHRWSSARFR